MIDLKLFGSGLIWQDLNNAMDQRIRRIFGRVEITYTDPFLDASIDVRADQAAEYTSPLDTANNQDEPTYKWFSLHNNKLDGSFHPMPSKNDTSKIDYSVGWWSEALSDQNGFFLSYPTLFINFQARPIMSLKVVGDLLLDCYPVDFRIKLFDALGGEIFNLDITDNDQVNWEQQISPVLNVTQMQLSIMRINQPFSASKILQFYTSVSEMYEGDDIFSIKLLEEQEHNDGTHPIGNISSNEISVRLNNINDRFSGGNDRSSLSKLLLKNRRLRAWLGTTVYGETHWFPLGEFWTMDWDAPEKAPFAEITARDRLDLLRESKFSTSEVYENKSFYDLFKIILLDAGLKEDEFEIDPALKDDLVQYAWFDRISHRAALTKLSKGSLSKVYCSRSGKIIVKIHELQETSNYTFSDDINIFDKNHPLAWSQSFNYVEVAATPYRPGEMTKIYDEPDEMMMAPGEKEVYTIHFDHVPCVDIQDPIFESGPSIRINNLKKYAWGVSFELENQGTTQQSISNLMINGKKLEKTGGIVAIAKDDLHISNNGEQKIEISNEFIQTRSRARLMADEILSTYKDPRRDITLYNRGHIALQLGDRITAPDYRDVKYSDYYIIKQSIEWDGALKATTQGQRIPK